MSEIIDTTVAEVVNVTDASVSEITEPENTVVAEPEPEPVMFDQNKLSPEQLQQIFDLVNDKDKINAKLEELKEQQELTGMTPEQREIYLLKKEANEAREKLARYEKQSFIDAARLELTQVGLPVDMLNIIQIGTTVEEAKSNIATLKKQIDTVVSAQVKTQVEQLLNQKLSSTAVSPAAGKAQTASSLQDFINAVNTNNTAYLAELLQTDANAYNQMLKQYQASFLKKF